MLRTGLLPTDSMYKGALSSGGREFSGMDIYYGHSVPEGYRMNPRLFYFQIQMELKGKSKRLQVIKLLQINLHRISIWVFVSIASLRELFEGNS